MGGEPFEPANQKALLPFMQRLRKMYPNKTVWCYTGYDLEKDLLTGRLCDYEITRALLDCIDILVDGEFVEAKKTQPALPRQQQPARYPPCGNLKRR